MKKPVNETIGHIICPIMGDKAKVRRNRNGKLYYVGRAGMITPNLIEGQNWMLENAVIYGKGHEQEKPQPVPVSESEQPLAPKSESKAEPKQEKPSEPLREGFLSWLAS